MDKLRMESPDMTSEHIDKIANLFPNCVTEMRDANGKLKRGINFEILKQMLSPDVVDGDECYEFTWVGKKAAMVEANKPTRQTLRPCPEESKNWDTTENLYIEGDNLQVLKLLQESYLGKVKMIYIDPPYNTGHDFIYNDHFEMDKDEYEQQTSMFDEDGNRNFTENTDSNPRFHSDWCSMMYSRLMLARNLLTEDGVVFISIDDNECANLLKICGEVFGKSNFVADISWQRTYSPRNDSKGMVREVEHIVVFSKQSAWMPNYLPRTEEMDSKYKNPDNDVKPWTSSDAFASDAATHQGMVYAIQHPFTGEMIYPYVGAHWRYQQDAMLQIMNGWTLYTFIDLHDEEKRAEICGLPSSEVRQGVKALVLALPFEVAKQQAQTVLERGQWPRFYFTQNGKGGIRRKTYIDNVGGKLPTNFWPYSEVGHTDEAKKEIKNLFDGSAPFDTPKPVRLLDRMLTIATDKDSIVLDFFSGSATTAHAVMQKNAQDGGHRKFILVQLPEESPSPNFKTICEIGKERIRRAGAKIEAELLEIGSTAPEGEEAQPVDLTAYDTGFRVFKLDDSNMRDVYFAPDDYSQDMLSMMESNIKPDRTALDLLFGCLLEWGLPLSMPYHSETIDGCTVHTYNDGDLIACFDEKIPATVIEAIARRKPLRAVFRDAGFTTSPEKINLTEIFKLLAPDTRVKVI
ncbi:MAG TPA: site-specific DNA-methyltransferase [Subdoligranulum variabile]|uniref:Site-specific DNA-methyltransferase n=1 Tax=Subdoligranulum variabile TaxID=214851 RepID=A0A921IHE3_9FIRM|nr:site-specific DNA-methyltransferase [Subdoligranulum variabile]